MPTRYPLGHTKIDPRGKGYWHIKAPTHPLAQRAGWVPRHRALLYAHLGATDQPCDICGYIVPWLSIEGWQYCINVDHINSVKGDDRIENLRPLCSWCNANSDQADSNLPEEWEIAVRFTMNTPPWDRPPFYELLAVMWEIPSDWTFVHLRHLQITGREAA